MLGIHYTSKYSIKRKRWSMVICVFFIFSLVGFTGKIDAHSKLEKAIPANGQTLKTSPSTVELWFKDPVEAYSNAIIVTNQKGKEIQKDKPQVDSKDKRHVIVPLQSDLPSGKYKVEIDVLALDGHTIKESYSFDVETPAVSKEEQWKDFELEKSTPTDGMMVPLPIKQMDLWFTQSAKVDMIGVFNDKNEVVGTKKPYVDPNNPKHLVVPFDNQLAKGTYKVFWMTSIKGKSGEPLEKEGIFYFAVEEVTSIAPSKTAPLSIVPSDISVKSIPSWLVFVGLLTLLGGTWFQLVIAKGKGELQRWKKVFQWLCGLSLVSFIILLFQQWSTLSQTTRLSLADFISLHFTWVSLLQVVLVIFGWMTKERVRLLFLAFAVLLWSLIGHSILPRYGGIVAIGMDALHLLAASIWVGGILALILMVPKENSFEWVKEVGKRYSNWAVVSIAVLVLTGIGMTLDYVPSFTWTSLIESNWGKMLFIKLLLFMGIIILGFLQRRALQKLTETYVIPFFRRAKSAYIVALFILFAAALLVDYSPSAAEQGIYPQKVVEDGITATIDISSFRVGPNDITIHFQNQPEFKQVTVKFSMPPDYIVENRAFTLGNGTYKLTGNFLHGPGTTYMEVKAVTSEGKKMVFPFRLQVPGEMQTN